MAKRKSINRVLRRSSRHRSSDSMNSALLDPDTDIVGEGRTFWWNNLEESTPPRYSRIYSRNETARQLNDNSQIDFIQSPSEWWKNLETSNSKHTASTKHNFSAGIVKRNILQTSTSESEKESERNLKKVQLKARKRKSINNAFLKALDDTETAVGTIETSSLNLSHPNIEKAISNTNEIVVSSHASDESIEIPSGKYLKPKSRFIQRARKSIGKNAFADALADNSSSFMFNPNKENDINEAPLMPRLSSLSPSKRSVNRSKNNITNKSSSIHKSPRLSLNVAKRQSLDLQAGDNSNSDSSDLFLANNKSRKKLFEALSLTPKSRLLQSSHKSVTKKPNLFEEILEENGNISARKSNVSAEDNRAFFTQDETEIRIVEVRGPVEMEASPQPRENRTASEKESDDISLALSIIEKQLSDVQAKDNVEADSSGSSLDNDKSRRKRIFGTTHLKPKSRILESLRKNANKKSVEPNRFEEIFKEDGNISARKSHVPIEGNRTSFKRDESVIRIADVYQSEEMEKSPQTKGNRTTSEEDSDISFTSSSDQFERSKSKELDVSLEHRNTQAANNLANLSKSISQKSTVIKTPKKQASFSRKSTRKETLEEVHTRTNAILPIDRTSINETIRHETVSDYIHDDLDIEQDLPKRMSKSSPRKELRVLLTRSLTDNFLKNRSETPKPANVVHEIVDNSRNNTNKDSSVPKQMSKSGSDNEARLTRNSFRNRSETPKRSPNQNTPERFQKSVGDIEDDVNVDSDINIGSVSQIISSTRISKVGTSIGTRKSTGLRLEMESSDDEDAEPARQTIQQNPTKTKKQNSMKTGTSSTTINRQSIQNSNRTSIREGREIARKHKSNSFKSLRKIDDFFKVKQTPTTLEQSNERAQRSQIFKKMEKIKTDLERIKIREMAAMNIVMTDKKKFPLEKKDMKSVKNLKQATNEKPLNHTKGVNKAFLVNGKVYKTPRLPRPKHWATDRLYKFLWNHMELKYKLATRVKSEKFLQALAKTVAIVERRKKYETYKAEVNALMKEMTRLNIINTRNDFYHFCQDFMPYEFRVKVVPILMPGNKNNIPYNSELLHVPLLDDTQEE